jgi:hypothetical protein
MPDHSFASILTGAPPPYDREVSQFALAKLDEGLGLVFGWALICKKDGLAYFDLQGDHIPEPAMLDAATEFMLSARHAGDMHQRNAVDEPIVKGTVVFAFPLTGDIAKAMGIATDQTGLMIAMKPSDPAILAKFKSGEYTGFSIGGHRLKDKEYTP